MTARRFRTACWNCGTALVACKNNCCGRCDHRTDEEREGRSRTWRLVLLTLCRNPEPHRPHHWGYRRFCRGGWRERWS